MLSLSGKVAIVTGASRGIGKGIALKLAAQGAKVVVCATSLPSAQKTADEIALAGGCAVPYALNVCRHEEVAALYAFTEECFGGVDALVCNAGINRDAILHKMTDEQWFSVIETNLTGSFFLIREAALRMRRQKNGRIVAITSMSRNGNIGQANYAASKAGIVGLTLTAAKELARCNVTCNAVCPGFIETDMTRGIPDDVRARMIDGIPVGRAGQPEDIASAVAFLLSEEASFITGQVINVTGGEVS